MIQKGEKVFGDNDWSKEYIDPFICYAWVATAIVGSGALGAAATAYSANQASSAQTQAATTAANENLQQSQAAQGFAQGIYNNTVGAETPYESAGTDALSQLDNLLPTLTAPINMNESTLENTPGYQFNLTQGLKAVQNSAAARGLGTSGAALKGAATFATGLADNTYQDQFNNANTNNTNAYNRLMGLIQGGQTAVATTAGNGAATAGTNATAGMTGATNVANAVIGSGNAQAAASNATGAGVNNLTNNIAGYSMYQGLYGGNNNNSNQAAINAGAPGVSNGGYNFLDAQANP